MDEGKHVSTDTSQHASAPYKAVATRGEIAMSSPITLIEAITQALAWELEH
ncbi:alpha-ketoacid dehydrogenase subunit beta, partial [Xanthomonas oryzae pv. oryzae]